MPDEATSVGAALAAAREQRGLSVADVAERTRIRSTLIRDIEADRFDRCGGMVYARGHLRNIAQVVGLDPGPLLERFDADHGNRPAPIATAPIPAPSARDQRKDRKERKGYARVNRSGPNWATAMIAVVALVFAVLAVSIVAQAVKSPKKGDAHSSPPKVSHSAKPKPKPKPSASSSSPTPSPTPSGVNVVLRVTKGQSWIKVLDATGKELYQDVMRVGDVQTFHDPKRLTVRFGNSPVIDVTMNGQDLGPPPCKTEVCSQEYPPTAAGG
ncbi:MAG: helix-turn-helix domain-containing protein [Mycobacteriales bacterium]